MKKNVFLLVILTTAMMISCDKNLQQNSNNPIDVRTDDPNYIEFEYNLNSSFVTTPLYIKISKVHTISLSQADGYVTQSEKNRITGEIQTLVNSGVVPVLIDVNIDENQVNVIEQFNVASSEAFVEVRSDGELGSNGSITQGHFCNQDIDDAGAGVGRVGTKYYNNYINNGAYPAYYDDIRQVKVYAGCNNAVFVTQRGHVRIQRQNFWKDEFSSCENEDDCMSSSDLSDNYNELVNAISNNLGSNKKVVGVLRCHRYEPGYRSWDFTFYFVNVLSGPPTYQ